MTLWAGANNSSNYSRHQRQHWSFSLTVQLACIAWIFIAADAFLPAPSSVRVSLLDQRSSSIGIPSVFLLNQSMGSSDKEQHHTEMALEVGESAGGGGSSTAIPNRGTGKHNARTKRKKLKKQKKKHAKQLQKKGPYMGDPLKQDELANHVAASYVAGRNGMMHKNKLKSNRVQSNVSKFSFESSPTHQQHLDYIKKLDRHPSLVLNADYQPMSYLPLSMWNWQEAVKGVFSGKVTVVDVYPDVMIRAANLEIPLPSVIALNEYVPQFNHVPAFTKRNVFLRDEYTCQYCNEFFHTRDLSLDHVVPRCRGGRLNWENAVTSCRKCNGRKGSLPVNKLGLIGMKLSKEPFVPTQFQLAASAARMLPRRVHPTWEPYLGLSNGKNISPKTAKAAAKKAGGKANEGELFFDDL